MDEHSYWVNDHLVQWSKLGSRTSLCMQPECMQLQHHWTDVNNQSGGFFPMNSHISVTKAVVWHWTLMGHFTRSTCSRHIAHEWIFLWLLTQIYRGNWSGVQLCSDPMTPPHLVMAFIKMMNFCHLVLNIKLSTINQLFSLIIFFYLTWFSIEV